jgi:hypothetical protein
MLKRDSERSETKMAYFRSLVSKKSSKVRVLVLRRSTMEYEESFSIKESCGGKGEEKT